MNINSPITEIKGVGEKTKDSFTKLGVYTPSFSPKLYTFSKNKRHK